MKSKEMLTATAVTIAGLGGKSTLNAIAAHCERNGFVCLFICSCSGRRGSGVCPGPHVRARWRENSEKDERGPLSSYSVTRNWIFRRKHDWKADVTYYGRYPVPPGKTRVVPPVSSSLALLFSLLSFSLSLCFLFRPLPPLPLPSPSLSFFLSPLFSSTPSSLSLSRILSLYFSMFSASSRNVLVHLL